MGKSYGVVLAIGVLFVVTAPLVFAGEPRILNPVADPVEEAAAEGQGEANGRAQAVQDEAARLQESASETKHLAIGTVESASSELTAGLVRFLDEAQGIASHAVGRLLCYLAACDADTKDSGQGYGSNQYRIQSDAAVPVTSDVLAGIAMVVAACGVGGALLWATVFQRGVAFGALPLLSRIAHSEIYTNEARRMIADIAVSNPGLCLNEIVTRTGYSRNAVSYHLFVLEKEEALVSIKDGKYRRYFPRGGKYVNGAKNVVSALRNETTLKMAQHIAAKPGTIQRELCQVLGTTASAACWHAKRLETLGVIRKLRVANTVQYFPGDELGRHDYSEFGLPGALGLPAGAAMALPTGLGLNVPPA